MKISVKILFFYLLTGSFFLFSCRKDAGEGGTSTIWGRLLVKDYNSTYTILQETYYGQDVDVYIIYGDHRTFDDRTRTSYDGTWEFKYLRPGDYHIYAYSEDSTLQTNASIPVIRDVTITDDWQTIEVPEMVIFK